MRIEILISNQTLTLFDDDGGVLARYLVSTAARSADAAAYWHKLSQGLKAEGNESVTNCHALKMQSADGKMRLTDVTTTEQLFRLIQSIPSPKAEPFKLWLAQIASECLGWP